MDTVTFSSFISLIGNFGFPVAITLYLLMRFEKKIDTLTMSIENLREVINRRN
ncbi:YvrJ family protein (plasmid) [Bacillus thuringiensis]|uniref:YvrJ family protein n=1 Tax=Bacillus wiedmannii TaxID=1890302 RepID=UPI000D09689B|nr:YvrJ family protein [Bacillus wiedmannii]PRT15848.1 YvrJ family protein [Bacillus wiedmannii]QPW51617.1 YvrJ family protein [Bacillus thuringiensis]